MLSISNLLCQHAAGNERLRYGHHAKHARDADHPQRLSAADPFGGAPRPVVVWAVTKACNLKCVHCYASADANPSPDELTNAEGKALLEDIKKFGCPAVLFSGGEPLVRPDVLDLIAHARSLELPVTLSTNGLLINEAMADNLLDVGLRYVGISIDGIRERHDKLRGMEGAFDQTLAAIDRCVARGIKVGLRFTVHGLNYHDLDEIFSLCVDHGIARLCIYHLAYSGRGDGMQKVDLEAGKTRDIVDHIFARTQELHAANLPLEVLTVGNHTDAAYLLLQLEKTDPQRAIEVRQRLEGTGGNRSGCNISSIDPTGNVHYDQFSWHYTCGNVRQRSFSEIWSRADDNRLAILRDRQAHLPEKCRGCRFLSICNGNLRTRAEAATGNWLGMDPSCYLTDEEVLEQVATHARDSLT